MSPCHGGSRAGSSSRKAGEETGRRSNVRAVLAGRAPALLSQRWPADQGAGGCRGARG